VSGEGEVGLGGTHPRHSGIVPGAPGRASLYDVPGAFVPRSGGRLAASGKRLERSRQADLDPSVLGPSIGGVIRGDRLVLSVTRPSEEGRVDPALLQVTNHCDGPGSRELPARREALGVNGHVVRVTLDPNDPIVRRCEGVGDLPQGRLAICADRRRPRGEENPFVHPNSQLPL